MSPDSFELLKTWPALPAGVRRPLYVIDPVGAKLEKELAEKGWEVTDIRLLSDRVLAVQATLEAASYGLVDLSAAQQRALELEARILGIFNSKAPPKMKKPADESIKIEDLIKFSRDRPEPVKKAAKSTKLVRKKVENNRAKSNRVLKGAVLWAKVRKLIKADKHAEARDVIRLSMRTHTKAKFTLPPEVYAELDRMDCLP